MTLLLFVVKFVRHFIKVYSAFDSISIEHLISNLQKYSVVTLPVGVEDKSASRNRRKRLVVGSKHDKTFVLNNACYRSTLWRKSFWFSKSKIEDGTCFQIAKIHFTVIPDEYLENDDVQKIEFAILDFKNVSGNFFTNYHTPYVVFPRYMKAILHSPSKPFLWTTLNIITLKGVGV